MLRSPALYSLPIFPEVPSANRKLISGTRVPKSLWDSGKTIPATEPDACVEFTDGEHTIQALLFNDLVLSDAKPGSPSFRCVVIVDPRYREPLVLLTNLVASVSAQAGLCVSLSR